MDILTRFGAGAQLYEFGQANQISLRDNFRNVVPKTTRLPGVSGGFDEYGALPAPGEIGNVQVVFWVHAENVAEMTTLKDALGQLASWGVKRLYKQPVDTEQGQRYCEARINSIDYTDSVRDMPHLRQRVTMNFQVANPVWLEQGTETASWGDGTLWGSGAVWGGTAAANACTGTSTDFTLTTAGNATTYPRIKIVCGAGQTATNVRVQRLDNGAVVDEIQYDDTLIANDSLVVNCRALSIRLNGANAYGAAFDYQRAGWMRLEAGENAIRVLMDNPGDACSVYFYYFEAYK